MMLGALDKFMKNASAIMDQASNIFYCTTNLLIEVDGDRTKAEPFLLTSSPHCCEDGTAPNSRIVQASVYYDHLVRVDDQWKIKHRAVKIDGAPAKHKSAWTADA
jgi:hypothetical protein